MARTPKLVPIKLHILMQLLNYRWAAANSEKLGEIGSLAQEDLTAEIDRQSVIRIKPSQLADLVCIMKEAIVEKIQPRFLDPTPKNHMEIMESLVKQHPTLFKRVYGGDIVLNELEARDDV